MSNKKITLDYSDYLKMVEELEVMKEALEEEDRIYFKSYDLWHCEYSFLETPKCINDFVKSISVKAFKKLKKQIEEEK